MAVAGEAGWGWDLGGEDPLWPDCGQTLAKLTGVGAGALLYIGNLDRILDVTGLKRT